MRKQEKIAVIGLGYVGLPLALALAKKFKGVAGFDISQKRIDELKQGHDWAEEHLAADIRSAPLTYTHEISGIADATFFIVTVPTPITADNKPNLNPVLSACRTVGAAIKSKKAAQIPVVVFESTVYPGLTEEICAPEIEKASGLVYKKDFRLGYSPERINPGDPVHKLESIVKVVAADDAATVERLEAVYGAVITAGLHRAPSIAVAEAAKVIENTQRDLNVALMNELALICDRLNIRTRDVLDAAGTKWNFLKFTPGLVGGHCIGVDPYYLTTKAESLGYTPEVILAGRRINDGMGGFVANKILEWLAANDIKPSAARIGVLGLTFKENVRDLRNSRVPDIVNGLDKAGARAFVFDPMVDPMMAREEYGIPIVDEAVLQTLDVLVLAVPHKMIMDRKAIYIKALREGGLLMDIKSALPADAIPPAAQYWSL